MWIQFRLAPNTHLPFFEVTEKDVGNFIILGFVCTVKKASFEVWDVKSGSRFSSKGPKWKLSKMHIQSDLEVGSLN